jgi:uncharacterized membrane protein YjgN (DUF898 family)
LAEFEAIAGRIVPLTPRQAMFHGTGGALFGIYLRNILLTLVTLGVYYLWGKNRLRTYLAGQCEFEGDRFAWHGTGRELFLGALKVLVVLVPIVFLAYVAPVLWKSPGTQVVGQVMTLVVYSFLIPLGMVGVRRYRFSRLSWRGIRFSFRGRVRDFLKLFWRGSVLTGLTLGLYAPYFQTQTRKFFFENTYFGNARFTFSGKWSDLFGRLLLALLVAGVGFVVAAFSASLSVDLIRFSQSARSTGPGAFNRMIAAAVPSVAIGVLVAIVAYFWYLAYRHRYFWSHTSFGTATFRSTMTAAKLLWQTFSNLLLLAVTVGLAVPWVMIRNIRFTLANIALVGSVDLKSIAQEAQTAGATVESMADMLHIDFMGFDLPF